MAMRGQDQKCGSHNGGMDRRRLVVVRHLCNPQYPVIGPLRFCRLHTFAVRQIQSGNHCGLCRRIGCTHILRKVGLQKTK